MIETSRIFNRSAVVNNNQRAADLSPLPLQNNDQQNQFITCFSCKMIPLIDHTAVECTSCRALFCEPCIIKHYKNQDKLEKKGCMKCGKFSVPFYTFELS